MSRAKRKRLEKDASRRTSEHQDENTGQGKRLLVIVSAVFLVLIGVIVGINYYFSADQQYYRIDIITVEDKVVDMDYFVRRCHATGIDPMSALSGLTKELVVQVEAESVGLEVTNAQIEAKMMETAAGAEGSISRSEFDEWLKQRLNETRMTEKEYKEIVRSAIIAETFYNAIVDITPTTTEQVHLHVIAAETKEQAQEIADMYNAGSSFSDLAMEYSIDSQTRELGGDAGWVPAGVLYEGRWDNLLFSELEPGEVSEPQIYYDSSSADSSSTQYSMYYLFMISEKEASHEIDDKYLDEIYANAYEAWMSQKMQEYTIKYHGIKNGFDSETYSWISWQLQKMTGEDQEAQ